MDLAVIKGGYLDKDLLTSCPSEPWSAARNFSTRISPEGCAADTDGGGPVTVARGFLLPKNRASDGQLVE